jgi:hypothetical protein
MELVEGEDLAARVGRGPLPVEEALAIARQIAEALEAAHEKGIVHRDLKPANVKVRADGAVKVLDFGLAKAMDLAGGASSGGSPTASPALMHSPTLTGARFAHGTELGVILGTAAYMSPEQARGSAVDKRSDVWAFGVVLYEMLAGGSLFAGESVAETVAGVLKSPIDLARLPAGTPPAIRRLVRRCLERDPRNRLHDVADARIVIDEVIRGGDTAEPAGAAPPPPRGVARRELAAWAVAAVATIAGLALLLGGKAPSGEAPLAVAGVTRFAVVPEEPGRLQGFPALSPDGRTLVYALRPEDGPVTLWAHSFESGASRRIAGTEGGGQPFWSPDGRRLAFFAGGQLRRLDLGTGLAQALAPVADARGGTWGADGEIYLSANAASGISQVPAASGASRPTTALDSKRGEESHRFPWALPGGGLLYTVTGNPAVRGIYWRGAGAAAARRLLPDVSRAAYDGRGQLLWVRDRALVAQRFDLATGALSGEIAPLAEAIGSDQQATAEDWFAVAAGT